MISYVISGEGENNVLFQVRIYKMNCKILKRFLNKIQQLKNKIKSEIKNQVIQWLVKENMSS